MNNKVNFKELYEMLYKMPGDEYDEIIFNEGFYGDKLKFVTIIKEFMMHKKQEEAVRNEKY